MEKQMPCKNDRKQRFCIIVLITILLISIVFILIGFCISSMCSDSQSCRDELIHKLQTGSGDPSIFGGYSITGGNIEDIKTEISNNKVRSNVVDFGTKAITNVMHAIDDFYYRFYSKERSLYKSSIDEFYKKIMFVNQGYNNVIVKIDEHMLRIRKYMPESIGLDIFNNNDILFKFLRSEGAKVGHILVPLMYQRYPTDPKSWFMYWEIPPLKRIHNYDPDKLKECLKSMYKFITFVNHANHIDGEDYIVHSDGSVNTQRSSKSGGSKIEPESSKKPFKIMYLDYKYENFMADPNGQYLLADYDFPPCRSMTETLKNKLGSSETDVNKWVKQLIGQDKKFSADYNFLINPIALSYYVGHSVSEVEEKYDPYLMLTALSMRLFCMQLETNRGTNNINGFFKLTDKVVAKLLDMKSTNEIDVFDISGF